MNGTIYFKKNNLALIVKHIYTHIFNNNLLASFVIAEVIVEQHFRFELDTAHFLYTCNVLPNVMCLFALSPGHRLLKST